MRRNATKLWLIVFGIVLLQLSYACTTKTTVTQPTPQPAEPTVVQQKSPQEPQLPAPLVVQQRPSEGERTLDRGLETLTQQLTASLPQEKKLLVAVLDFNDLADNISAFGRLVNEELVTKLFQTQRVRVIERGLLEKALSELKFTLSGLVDPTRAKQLGKQVGADAIVTGTITDLGNLVKINGRMIEVEKGDVLAAGGAEVSKSPVIAELMKQLLSGAPQVSAATKEAQQEQPSGGEAATAASPKKVGNLMITVKKIVVARDQVSVILNFLNQADKELKLGMMYDDPPPTLTDQKGNGFEYAGGLAREVWQMHMIGKALTLNPRSNNDVVLYFKSKEEGLKVADIGDNFMFSLTYKIYDPKDKSLSTYSVLFTDMKAQMPQ